MKNKWRIMAIAMIMVFATFQLTVASAPKDSWISKTNMSSTREGLTVTAVDGKIYVIDGYGYVGGNFVGETNITQVYDPATDSWINKTSSPTRRCELTATAHHDKIYVFGGRGINNNLLNITEIYSTTTDTWMTGMPMPTARAGLASASIGHKIYVIGGRNTTAPRPIGGMYVMNTVEVYDMVTNTWSSATSLNKARSDLVAVAHGGKIYAIGGWDGTNVVATVEVYNPTKDTWTMLTDMPTARSNLVAETKGNTIYAIGGVNDSLTYLDTTEAYNIAKGKWTAKAPMITARSEMDCARIGDKIYVIGGGIYGALIGGNLNEAYIAK